MAVRAEITADLVRDLLRDQHPDLSDRPIRLGARGWDNQIWRLGDDLAVRLPWATEAADEKLRKEHAWVPTLAPSLPLQIPVPQRFGEPSERFSRPWTVTTWVPGEPADRAPATRAAAGILARFLSSLHQPAPTGAPSAASEGSLADRSAQFAERLISATEIGAISDPAALRRVWEDAVTTTEWAGSPLWLHGDLHPANVLTTDGTICGVIDFGGLAAGDPAIDLAAPWLLLSDDGIAAFHSAYRPRPDAATLRRARGWAALQALDHVLIGEAGAHGRPGGKATWGPPARATLRRLTAAARH